MKSKNNEKQNNKKFKKEINISFLLLIFLYAQPILDVSYAVFKNILNIDISINTIIRLIFFLISLTYILFKSHDKKAKSFSLAFILYGIIFATYVYFQKGLDIIFYEGRNFLSTFYFPITLIFMYIINKEKNEKINNKNLAILNYIYLAFIIIPNLLNIGFDTYMHDKAGKMGLFYTANSISSVLIILMPFTIKYFCDNKRYVKLAIYLLANIYVAFTIGTKTPLIGMLLILMLLIFYGVIYLIKNKEKKLLVHLLLPVILMFILLTILIPKTVFYKNIKKHMGYWNIKNVEDIFKNRNFLDQVVFSRRLLFLERTHNNYKNASILEKLIGIGYVENYKQSNENYKLIEMDYFDVFYRHGLVGFLLFFSPFIYVLKLKISNKRYGFIAYVDLSLILLLALFSGHVLTSPSVSTIIIYILNKEEL